MNVDDLVRQHYSNDDLEAIVLDALRRAGADIDALRIDDLAGLDQLHAGFGAATEYVVSYLDLSPTETLLDLGSGIGGPARVAASRTGCRVTGIDLSPDFVALARSLTDRLGLGPLVRFDVGSGTELPFGDGSFSRAMLIHVGMNVADKPALFAEARRVLEPGGLFAVYDQMRTGPGELTYPMPWADDATSSFVESRERYAELLDAAGFRIELDEDRTAANAAAGPPQPGTLTPADLFGPGFFDRLGNNISAAMSGTLSAVLMVARAT